MEKRPDALLLTFPGTNCERETGRALEAVGFQTHYVPFAEITSSTLEGMRLLVFSGGFSYGDYIMAGQLARLEIQHRLSRTLHHFRDAGGYLLGICNGFQILMRLGLLPKGSLVANTSGRFICKWVGLENCDPKNPFLRELPLDFELPVAHAEGRFVGDAIEDTCITLKYKGNINGSFERIAGLKDKSGHVFGLMPHPERFLWKMQHCDPDWNEDDTWGWGYYFFKSIYQTICNVNS